MSRNWFSIVLYQCIHHRSSEQEAYFLSSAFSIYNHPCQAWVLQAAAINVSFHLLFEVIILRFFNAISEGLFICIKGQQEHYQMKKQKNKLFFLVYTI